MLAISPDLNTARLNAVVDFLDAGPNLPYVEIYSGTRPTTFGSYSQDGDLLVLLTFPKPFGTVSNGVLSVSPSNEGIVMQDGTATWARVYSGNNVIAWECDVSDLNGDGELKMPSVGMYAGGFARIVSGTLV